MKMKTILAVPAYLWAIACFLLIPVTFIKNDTLAIQLSKLPFMKIHPIYSGGKENRSYLRNGLHISVNEPVYTGLRDRNSDGFVQVRFVGIHELPSSIDERIDYDFDNQPDFNVSINTINGTTELKKLSSSVKSLGISSKVKNDWVIRINISNN